MRILWVSNAPWSPTGYGIQTNLWLWRLKKLGHELACTAFWGLQGAPLNFDDVMFLPGAKDGYGNDVIVPDAEYFKADIVITHVDNWVMQPGITSQVRHVPYFPVDHDPVPSHVIQSLKTAFRPINYSLWGIQKLAEVGIKAEYVPHGVDTSVYQPMDKVEARQAVGAPDDVFLVGLFAANKGNPSRKCFDQQIRAFTQFWRERPEANAMLYLHTDISGGYQGENIPRLIELAGLPRERIAQVPPYQYSRGMLGPDYMARAYNACDVLLHATRGEGFGVHIIEAQSCGVPAIVTDFSSMPELVDAGAGWKVPYSDKFYDQESYQVVPSVPGIVKALHAAYDARNDKGLKEKSRAGMIANYDADMVLQKYWKPVLENIEADIASLEARKAARAEKRKAARVNGSAVLTPDFNAQPTGSR